MTLWHQYYITNHPAPVGGGKKHIVSHWYCSKQTRFGNFKVQICHPWGISIVYQIGSNRTQLWVVEVDMAEVAIVGVTGGYGVVTEGCEWLWVVIECLRLVKIGFVWLWVAIRWLWEGYGSLCVGMSGYEWLWGGYWWFWVVMSGNEWFWAALGWLHVVTSGYVRWLGWLRMVRVGWSGLKSIGLNQFENLGLNYLKV